MKSGIPILFAALLLAPSASPAAVVINNLSGGTQGFSESLSGPDGLDDFGFPFQNHEIAFSFTTSSATVNLTEIAFLASIGGAGLSPIRLTLSAGASAPGGTAPVVLGSVTPGGNVPITQLLSVSPSSLVTLAANTTYWVHFTVPSGPDIYTVLSANQPVVEPGWSLGTTWRTDEFTPWEEINSILHPRVRLTVQAVPEASSFLIASLSAVLAISMRRRA